VLSQFSSNPSVVSLVTEKKVHVLLIEDERTLSHLIERKLQRAGYDVSLAYDGIEATAAAVGKEIDLIILDLNLPKKNGFEVLKELRGDGYATPVLILSARGDIDDRILGLELGADDYLVKPFDSAELVLRLQAILRRSGHARTSVLQAADLTMDVVKRQVVRGTQSIDLTKKEFSLLEFLLRNKNIILTRKRIAEEVWGYTFDTGTNIVDVYLSYLRDSVDKGFERKLIQTIRGEGFLLKDD
jgi:DNA-binding response OmpR family regulator